MFVFNSPIYKKKLNKKYQSLQQLEAFFGLSITCIHLITMVTMYNILTYNVSHCFADISSNIYIYMVLRCFEELFMK